MKPLTKEYRSELIRANNPNKNNRIYSREILLKAAAEYSENIINGRSFGELSHDSFIDNPFDETFNLAKASHIITSIYFRFPKIPRKKKKVLKKLGKYNKDSLFVSYKLLNSKFGKTAMSLISELSPSPCGIGEVDEFGVIGENYKLLTINLIPKKTKA
jgi:hypothetical protein